MLFKIFVVPLQTLFLDNKKIQYNFLKKVMKAIAIKSSLFSCLKTYNKKTFMSDLMAGIIVGIVALPLAIAFGIASGVTPEKGIIDKVRRIAG